MESFRQKWYDNKVLVHVLFVLIFPIGLYGIWKNAALPKWWKVTASGFVVLILIAIAGDNDSTDSNISDSQTTEAAVEQQVDVSADQPVESVAEQGKTNSSEKPAKWNTSELNVEENGNIEIAIAEIKKVTDSRAVAVTPSPSDVRKRPWDYYGKIVKVTGTVEDVQEYPPTSDLAKQFGTSSLSEVVLRAEDGTIADFFLTVSASTVNEGDTVAAYGLPTGTLEADNKIGGKFTHVVLVGNAFDK